MLRQTQLSPLEPPAQVRSMMKTLAIAGSSLAGLSAARAARAEGFDGRLVLVGDEHGRSRLPGVVAVGDCAAWHDQHLGRPHRLGHWNAALTQPGRAIRALLGVPDPRPQAALRTFGPTSTASASSSAATPGWPSGSRSRQATSRATASWPSTTAGTIPWGCSAAPRRGSSPSGAATSSAPSAPAARRHTARP